MNGNIVAKVFCMQHQGWVHRDEMTFLPLPKGGRRRMCESCKDKAIERREEERKAKNIR